ncbi:hypothetical protein HDA39_000051 [Kribbella italica]|uniref:Uncharacterized protein n=1 Tax=Kribbella italica TaxID=1540520 RepID=A0A7W9J0C2_9ACTN|nr:hypothetical protein [Kribbella italica]
MCRTEYVETFTADLMALLRLASAPRSSGEDEVTVGIQWEGQENLIFEQKTNSRLLVDTVAGPPVPSFVPITTTVRSDGDDADFLRQVRALATDLVNQAGIQHLLLLEDAPD